MQPLPWDDPKIAHFPTHRMEIYFRHKKTFLRHGFRELKNKNWHDCCSWQHEKMATELFSFVGFGASVKVQVAEKIKIAKLRLKNEKSKETSPGYHLTKYCGLIVRRGFFIIRIHLYIGAIC